jgi:predicted flap endonuclease-1-like 5' DNA nuclease
MDEKGFRTFLKQSGRSPSAIERCIRYATNFADYLQQNREGKLLDEASEKDLKSYVDWVEAEPNASAKPHLWALSYYFAYTSNQRLSRLASALRQQRIKRKPFQLKTFRGVNREYAERLATVGIANIEQMLEAGRTRADRQRLSGRSGVALEAILEFVKLSDLARIGGVKTVRARLYYDAGIDTVEKLAKWDPEKLREYLMEFVQSTGFKGIAPTPKEARNAVKAAKRLPKIVEY